MSNNSKTNDEQYRVGSTRGFSFNRGFVQKNIFFMFFLLLFFGPSDYVLTSNCIS